jgi:hypothetical protein
MEGGRNIGRRKEGKEGYILSNIVSVYSNFFLVGSQIKELRQLRKPYFMYSHNNP